MNEHDDVVETPDDLLAAEMQSRRERLFEASQLHDWARIKSRARDLRAVASEVLEAETSDPFRELDGIASRTREEASRAFEEASRLEAAAESRLSQLGDDSRNAWDAIRRQRDSWAGSTRRYGALSVGVRLILLFSTAVVAGTTSIDGTPSNDILEYLVEWTPFFAITAAFLTALDTWLKPRDKWRGFMEMRDRAQALYERVAALKDGQAEIEIRNYFDQLASIRDDHREKNVI